MTTFWRVQYDQITELSVLGHTEKSVIFDRGGRNVYERKHTEWAHYFETRPEAVSYLRDKLKVKIACHQFGLSQAEAALKRLEDEEK